MSKREIQKEGERERESEREREQALSFEIGQGFCIFGYKAGTHLRNRPRLQIWL